MLTKDILFGMNLLTLAGFVVLGLTLTLNRMGQAGKSLSLSLMAAGTALVFLGLCARKGRDRRRSPRPDRGFTPPYEISYHGVKLPRISAALRRFNLRRGADLPPGVMRAPIAFYQATVWMAMRRPGWRGPPNALATPK